MKHIEKTAPRIPCLDAHGATPNATYIGLPGDCKKKIRENLLREQGYLCAYCMGRISGEWNQHLNRYDTEVEHFQSQKKNRKMNLRYSNFLAVCNGEYIDKGNKILHCDKTDSGKGDGSKSLRKLDPLLPSCEKLVKYTVSGKIESVNGDADVEYDLNTMLNLNATKLLRNREEVLKIAAKRLKKQATEPVTISKSLLNNEIKHWTDKKENKFKPFCQVAVWYLKKKLNKAV